MDQWKPQKNVIKSKMDKYIIRIKLYGQRVKINFKIEQFGILINNTTTGHKLQGMSKYILVVADYWYKTINWVYMVLSRVKTLKWLFSKKPLDPKKYFINDTCMVEEEKRLLEIEKQALDNIDL